MNTLTPGQLMERRLASKRFPSLDAKLIAILLCLSAFHVDLDGLNGVTRAALAPLMASTGLGDQAVYDGVEALVRAGFLVNLDDDMGRDYVTYAIRVQALPAIASTHDQHALERLAHRDEEEGCAA